VIVIGPTGPILCGPNKQTTTDPTLNVEWSVCFA